MAEAVTGLATHFRLSDQERSQLLPSGRQPTFDNRVAWALTYLSKAGLLERTGRGRFQITQRGVDLLAESPTTIDYKFLMRYPEFQEFRLASVAKPSEGSAAEAQTPEESLETSFQTLKRSLAQELLDRVKKCPPRFFEQLVVDLLVAMGYGGSRQDAGHAVGRTGDGGIDGIIKEDRLGLDVVYLQAKRWQGSVGSSVVREFAGSLEGHRAQKGVLITTSEFTKDAREFVERVGKKIILIDGQELTNLMVDFNVGVTPLATYEIKRLDLDYFPEDLPS